MKQSLQFLLQASRIPTVVKTILISLLFCTAYSVQAPAAVVRLNEILANPPGTDNGREFFELKGTPNDLLTGLTFLVLEGEANNRGTIDQVISFSGTSLGTNGLFLQRDSATALTPAPAVGTNTRVGDFNPDIENGGNTYLLVRGFSGNLNDDLDTDDNGVLNTTKPWTSVDDAVGYFDSADGGGAYAQEVGGTNFSNTITFTPDVVFRDPSNGNWIGADVALTPPTNGVNGPYSVTTNNVLADGSSAGLNNSYQLTPGSENQAVPEPLTMIGWGSAIAFGGVLKRKFNLKKKASVA